MKIKNKCWVEYIKTYKNTNETTVITHQMYTTNDAAYRPHHTSRAADWDGWRSLTRESEPNVKWEGVTQTERGIYWWKLIWLNYKEHICLLVIVIDDYYRRCLTLSNPVPWQNWMAAYLGYTLRMNWRRCFVADQLWLTTRIREEEDSNRALVQNIN